jgi:hypothetical protein
MFVDDEIDLLVCTDAAAEGLNLQTADLLIQYDLPWNPTKAEQRIGRIDRIGSKHDIIRVVNLCYQEGVEAQVYDVLAQRLSKIIGVLGSQEEVLLPLDQDDFQLLAECATEKDRKATLDFLEEKATRRLMEFKRSAELVEIPAGRLVDIYARRLKKGACAPLTLDDIWSAVRDCTYLEALGCTFDDNLQTVTVQGIPGIVDGRVLTARRETWTRQSETLGFLSYGDADFDVLLVHLASWTDTNLVHVARGTRPGTTAPLVAISVSTQQGQKALLTWSDLVNEIGQNEGNGGSTELALNQRVIGNHVRANADHLRSVGIILRADLMGRMSEKPSEVRKNLRGIRMQRSVNLPDKAAQSFAATGVIGDVPTGSGGGYVVKVSRSGHRVLAAAMGRLDTGKGKEGSVGAVAEKLERDGVLDYPA